MRTASCVHWEPLWEQSPIFEELSMADYFLDSSTLGGYYHAGAAVAEMGFT
ncbi:hypothetical protein LM602_01640 [Candidatus Acetothermia bacterium]|jgi:hypothetical protein|nr:hypothetical protein [Candidatus Acetothermia bacterium]MCI2436860.1 hypothetical protein [Candidatus Acetothermia bacterium]